MNRKLSKRVYNAVKTIANKRRILLAFSIGKAGVKEVTMKFNSIAGIVKKAKDSICISIKNKQGNQDCIFRSHLKQNFSECF